MLLLPYDKFFNRKVTRVSEETAIVKSNKTQKQVEIIRRRELAIKLRCTGYTYRDILDIMLEVAGEGNVILPDSYDERYVWKDVNAVLSEAKEHLVESAEALRAIEMRNLDAMQASVMPMALAGKKDAIETVLKIMKQRQKYVPNLVEPQKVEVSTKRWEGEIIMLVKQNKITIEDVRDVAPEIADKIIGSLESGSEERVSEGDSIIEGEFSNVGEAE